MTGELAYIQTAISPVVLFSAYSLLLLSLTNRYSMVISRCRSIEDLSQKETMYKRVRILQASIILALVSIIVLIILILDLFVACVLKKEYGGSLLYIFSFSLLLILMSTLCFVADTLLSTTAIKEALDHDRVYINV